MSTSFWRRLRSRNSRTKTSVRFAVERLEDRWVPTILMVPSQYANINAAMTAAQSGDIIQLDPTKGPYSGSGNSNVEVTQNITIESSSSSVNAVIDPGDNEFVDAETADVSFTLQGLTIENCTGSEGAIFVSNNAISQTLTGCTFTNNELVIYNNSGSATITGCTFTGNGSSSGDGAIAWLNGALNISNSTFTNNTSAGGGGVISADAAGRNTPVTLTNCTFTGNSSAGYGGGVLLQFEGDGDLPVTVTNCVFLDNSTSTDGAVFAGFTGVGSGSITVVNSSFFGNAYTGGSASGQGTIAGTTSTSLTIINSIFHGDTTPNEISTNNSFESSSVTNSDIDQSGFAGSNGNIDADPKYVDAASGDLHTLPTSPVINAGTSGANVPTTDINGVTRDNPPDMGAYEYKMSVTNDAITPTQFQQFSGEVATFTDTDGEPAPATDFTATINWGDGTTPTTGSTTQPGGPGTAYSVAGSHTYTTSGAHTLTVTITTKGTPTPETAQDATSITVQADVATHFAVSAPASATAGTAFNVTVTALDAGDNTVANYTGTVHFTSSDAQAILPADATLTNGAGTFSITLETAGSQTITATDTTTSPITGTSSTVSVSAAAATHFAVSAPASATAGTAFNVTETALDAFNNTATGYAGTVHFTSSDAQAILPADATLTNGAGTFSITLETAGSQTITATDTTTSSITGTSSTVSVSAAAATHYAVSAPASATAGTAFNLTVTALDQFNNTATGYLGTVHFTSSDAQAILPADATLTNGVGTFSITLETAGSQTITATDTTSSSITGTSNTIAVAAAAATHFSVSAPTTATAGTSFSLTVTALDQFNNTATGYTGTVHFTSSDGQAVLPADATLTNGVGAFSATLETAGNQTITATDTTSSSITGTSNTIAVAAAAATHFSVSAPTTATAGTSFSFTVMALDKFDNTSTGYSGTVHFTSSDAAASLPADATLTDGVGTFSVTFAVGGTATISATDTTNASITGVSNQTTIDQAPAITSANIAHAVVFSAGSFTVTATGFPEPTLSLTGTLPAGMSFDSATGVLSGTPNTPKAFGTFPLTITASNGVGTDTTQNFELDVSGIPAYALTPNERYIAQVYLDLLDRVVDEPGMENWAGQLDSGVAAKEVILEIEQCSLNEYQTLEVANLYSRYLHRQADPGGLQTWVAFLDAGGTVEQVAANLIGSTEYFQKEGGGTNNTFLAALYQDVLNRPIDANSRAFYSNELSQGTTRTAVALSVLTSTEGYEAAVEAYYMQFLGRSADIAGLDFFIQELENGSADQEVIASIVGSSEFRNTRVG